MADEEIVSWGGENPETRLRHERRGRRCCAGVASTAVYRVGESLRELAALWSGPCVMAFEKLNYVGAILRPYIWVTTLIYPNESECAQCVLLRSMEAVPTLFGKWAWPKPVVAPRGA